jgi:hypothetical protein
MERHGARHVTNTLCESFGRSIYMMLRLIVLVYLARHVYNDHGLYQGCHTTRMDTPIRPAGHAKCLLLDMYMHDMDYSGILYCHAYCGPVLLHASRENVVQMGTRHMWRSARASNAVGFLQRYHRLHRPSPTTEGHLGT